MLTNIVDPPRSTLLVMSPDLERALTVIQKGAEEMLKVLKMKKSQLEKGETLRGTILKLIGHIEKVEPEGDDCR